MKVEQLITLLKKFDKELTVTVSRDPEGNGFSVLANSYTITNPEDYGIDDEIIDVRSDEQILILWPKH